MTTAQQTKRREVGGGGGYCLGCLQALAGNGRGGARAAEASALWNMQSGVLEVCKEHPLTQEQTPSNPWVSAKATPWLPFARNSF